MGVLLITVYFVVGACLGAWVFFYEEYDISRTQLVWWCVLVMAAGLPMIAHGFWKRREESARQKIFDQQTLRAALIWKFHHYDPD